MQAESLHRNDSLQMSSLHMNDESIHSGINRQRLGSRNENNYEEQSSMHSVHSNTSHSHSYRQQQQRVDQRQHYEDSRRPTLHSSNVMLVFITPK